MTLPTPQPGNGSLYGQAALPKPAIVARGGLAADLDVLRQAVGELTA